MRKQNRKSIVTSRRGFSLTEVVVGMTVILIVSAATLTTILSHMNFEKTIVQTIEATNIVENAIECFDAGGRSNFENYYFKNIYGADNVNIYDPATAEPDPAKMNVTFDGTTYTYNYEAMKVKIEIEGSTITIFVTSLETEESLLRTESVEYTR